MKQKRHERIIKIVTEKDIKTQEQMTDELRKAGFLITQATVSRDIKELGLIKLSMSDGSYKYAVTKEEKTDSASHITIFSRAVISVRRAVNNIVVRTHSGMANAVAASLDGIFGHEILGTIAGDDTILVILENESHAEEMAERLNKIFARKD